MDNTDLPSIGHNLKHIKENYILWLQKVKISTSPLRWVYSLYSLLYQMSIADNGFIQN